MPHGADGLALLSDPDKLYVNTAKDGKVTKITDLKLARPLQGPDGMRPIDGQRLISAEGIGGMEGGTPAVTVTKGMAADKGPFRLIPVPLPK